MLTEKVSVNAQNTSLQEVLQNLFDNNVSFKIEVLHRSLTSRSKQAAHNKQNTQ